MTADSRKWCEPVNDRMAVLVCNVCPQCGGAISAYQSKHCVDTYLIAPDGMVDDNAVGREVVDDGSGEMTIECRKCGFILEGYPVWTEQGKRFEFRLGDLKRLGLGQNRNAGTNQIGGVRCATQTSPNLTVFRGQTACMLAIVLE